MSLRAEPLASTAPITDVREQRRLFLENLRQEVQDAFTHRQVVELNPNKTFTKADEAKVDKPLPNKAVYHFLRPFPRPNQVFVDNPHDYPILLRMANDAMADSRPSRPLRHFWDRWRSRPPRYTPAQAEKLFQRIAQDAAHEWAHGIPILGQEKAYPYFGVVFYEDKDTGETYYQPITKMSGEVKREDLFDSLSAPDRLEGATMSDHDRRMLAANTTPPTSDQSVQPIENP